tara:strand:+ start:1126 stop:2055 length:930 start_codon:yes stop_codon:yes gene_type:complete
MGKYVSKTCFECGIRRPINLMKSKKIRVKTGNIGWGLSFNPARKKSARIQLPRNRYSNLTKYFCKNKEAHHKLDYYSLKKNKTSENSISSTDKKSKKPKGIIFWILVLVFWYIYLPYLILKYLIKLLFFKKKERKTNFNLDNSNKINFSSKERYLDLYYSEDFFDKCSVILGYKIANSDGKVEEIEFHNFVSNFLENSKLSKKEITLLWNDANNFDDNIIIKLIKRKYKNSKIAYNDLIINLCYIAEADGEITKPEYEYILKIGMNLEVPNDDLAKIINRDKIEKNNENKHFEDFADFEDFDEIEDLLI